MPPACTKLTDKRNLRSFADKLLLALNKPHGNSSEPAPAKLYSWADNIEHLSRLLPCLIHYIRQYRQIQAGDFQGFRLK